MDWIASFASEHFGVALQVLKIIWINILLSGDNAVVIALACRDLPDRERKWGLVLGSGVAVVLLIAFTLAISFLLDVPYLQLIGGLALLWIAVKLLHEEEGGDDVKAGSSLWEAVKIITIADIVMSLDNVVAVAAAAHGQIGLIVMGLFISIPLVVFGAALIVGLLNRFPFLVWAGAALLGWVAGELLASEQVLKPYIDMLAHSPAFVSLAHTLQPLYDAGAALMAFIAAIPERIMGGPVTVTPAVPESHQISERLVDDMFKVLGATFVLVVGWLTGRKQAAHA